MVYVRVYLKSITILYKINYEIIKPFYEMADSKTFLKKHRLFYNRIPM